MVVALGFSAVESILQFVASFQVLKFEGFNRFNCVDFAAVRTEYLLADTWFDISNSPPLMAAIALEMIEMFQTDFHRRSLLCI